LEPMWLQTPTVCLSPCNLTISKRNTRTSHSISRWVKGTSLRFKTTKLSLNKVIVDRDRDPKRRALPIRINTSRWNLEVKVSFN
jgi:hypothetical protein